jgi:uncharacterized membrane protein
MNEIELERGKLVNWILKIVISILSTILLAVVFVLLFGIFMPNDHIDNKDILSIINPAFNTIIGAFVGLIAGLTVNKGETATTATVFPPQPIQTQIIEEVVEEF